MRLNTQSRVYIHNVLVLASIIEAVSKTVEAVPAKTALQEDHELDRKKVIASQAFASLNSKLREKI